MTAPVGADIESICSKCGDVWHVVVAKVGERIAKVQCKQCGGFHRHKPPGGAQKAAPAAAAKAGPRRPASSSRSKKPPVPEPPAVAPDLSKPVKRYSPSDSYTLGERIQHPSFGAGIVESFPGAGKIQVAFIDGRRLLAAARAAPALARPTTSPND